MRARERAKNVPVSLSPSPSGALHDTQSQLQRWFILHYSGRDRELSHFQLTTFVLQPERSNRLAPTSAPTRVRASALCASSSNSTQRWRTPLLSGALNMGRCLSVGGLSQAVNTVPTPGVGGDLVNHTALDLQMGGGGHVMCMLPPQQRQPQQLQVSKYAFRRAPTLLRHVYVAQVQTKAPGAQGVTSRRHSNQCPGRPSPYAREKPREHP